MRLGRLPLILLSLALVPSVPALASDHWGQHELAQDFESGSLLFGVSGAYTVEIGGSEADCENKFCGYRLAFAGGFALGSESRARLYLGPRIALFPRRPLCGWGVWVQALGGVHASSEPTERSDHPFAWKIAVGADFVAGKERSLNAAGTHRRFRGWTVQLERVDPPGLGHSDAYYAAGIGYFWRKVKVHH